jgi:hypothetical protein
MLEVLFILGASGALSATWVALWKWARQSKRTAKAIEALDTSHAGHELVDIRSSVFKPNELVATLCVTCDVQLGPEVWQEKMDEALAALETPADHVDPVRRQLSRGELEKLGFRWSGDEKVPGSMNMLARFVCTKSKNGNHKVRVILHDKKHLARFMGYRGFGGLWDGEVEHKADSPYIQIRPSFPDPSMDPPKRSWSADDYRHRGWTTELLDSNFDHSEQKYVLPLFQKQRVNRLTFDSKAEATRWWGSCIPYDDFIAGRRTVRRGAGNIRSFSAGGVTETFHREVKRAITAEEEKLSEQIARLTGIPQHLMGKMSAAQAAEALNRASLGDVDEVEIRAWGVEEPIVIKRTPRGSWG